MSLINNRDNLLSQAAIYTFGLLSTIALAFSIYYLFLGMHKDSFMCTQSMLLSYILYREFKCYRNKNSQLKTKDN